MEFKNKTLRNVHKIGHHVNVSKETMLQIWQILEKQAFYFERNTEGPTGLGVIIFG